MDFASLFSDSLHQLIKNKRIVLVFFVIQLLFILGLGATLRTTPVKPLMEQFAALEKEFSKPEINEQYKAFGEKAWLKYINDTNPKLYSKFQNAVSSKEFWTPIILFLVVGIIFAMYLYSVFLVEIALAIKGKATISKAIEIGNRNVLRFFSAIILLSIITMAYFLFAMFFVVSATAMLKDLAAFANIAITLILVILFLAGYLYLRVKLTLVLPSVFLDNNGVIKAVKESWHLTKKIFWFVLGVIIVVGIVQAVFNYMFGSLLAIGNLIVTFWMKDSMPWLWLTIVSAIFFIKAIIEAYLLLVVFNIYQQARS